MILICLFLAFNLINMICIFLISGLLYKSLWIRLLSTTADSRTFATPHPLPFIRQLTGYPMSSKQFDSSCWIFAQCVHDTRPQVVWEEVLPRWLTATWPCLHLCFHNFSISTYGFPLVEPCRISSLKAVLGKEPKFNPLHLNEDHHSNL